MSKKIDDKKSIVVIGGGSGGAALAYTLSKTLSAEHELILIDPRSNHILTPSTIRLPVSNTDSLESRVLVPFSSILANKNSIFYQASVTSIQRSTQGGGHVVLDNGETVRYTVLVLAMGSRWYPTFSFPTTENEFTAKWATSQASIKSAKNIVLIGGGAVGIELSGEIKSQYPDKSVTVIHAGRLLLNDAYPDKFRRAVQAGVAAKRIDILLGERLNSTEIHGGRITTEGGNSISADLIIEAHGTKPNTALVAQSLGSDTLSATGYIKVRPTLQLLNYSNIFAVGDVVDFPEQKQLMKAQAHAAIVAVNAVALLNDTAMKDYKGTLNIIVLPIGKEGGISYLGLLWGITLGDWFTRRVKSQALLVPRLRGAFGLST